jgi:RNA-dependent RNA polymerase
MVRLNSRRFLNLASLLQSTVDEIHGHHRLEIDRLFPPSLKVSRVRRIVVTPTKVLLFFSEPNLSNRVTREFGADNFLRVRFRDEDAVNKLNTSGGSSGYVNMRDVYDRILAFINEPFGLCGREYKFLAMSASQLREHGCWLFASPISEGPSNGEPSLTADEVRQFMGDFRSIQNIGKYAARLGQSLSSSIETFNANPSESEVISDITVGEYVFTDGIGKISMAKAKEISEKYYKKKYISSFQIRFAGFKVRFNINKNLIVCIQW